MVGNHWLALIRREKQVVARTFTNPNLLSLPPQAGVSSCRQPGFLHAYATKAPAWQMVFDAALAGNVSALLLLAAPGTKRIDELLLTNGVNNTTKEFHSSGVSRVFASRTDLGHEKR
jgi:hypothetical protein